MAEDRDRRSLDGVSEHDLPGKTERHERHQSLGVVLSEFVPASAEALQEIASKIRLLAVLAPATPSGPPRFTFQIDGEKEVFYGRVLTSRHGERRDDGKSDGK